MGAAGQRGGEDKGEAGDGGDGGECGVVNPIKGHLERRCVKKNITICLRICYIPKL
jgi:hypothetical protein